MDRSLGSQSLEEYRQKGHYMGRHGNLIKGPFLAKFEGRRPSFLAMALMLYISKNEDWQMILNR